MPKLRQTPAFHLRRNCVAGLAGALTTALTAPALARFGFSLGGFGNRKDQGNTIDLNRLFSGIKSVFDGFTLDEKDEVRIGTKLFPRMIDRSGGAYANRMAQRGRRNFSEDLLQTAGGGRNEI